VLRDIDLLKQISSQSRAIVSFSFSSVDRELSSIFEPGIPAPANRLDAIRRLKKEGLTCGMFLMPVIPFLTDSTQQISDSVAQAKAAGVDFIIFGGMTLKEGQQKDYFMRIIETHFPALVSSYNQLYPGDRWGSATGNYYIELNKLFYQIAKRAGLPIRIPVSLCQDFLPENALVYVILDQMDYLLKSQGVKTTLGYVAFQISKLKNSLRRSPGYTGIKGVKPATEKLIQEILETGGSHQYRTLMHFGGINDEY
jgi:hypothetical protein